MVTDTQALLELVNSKKFKKALTLLKKANKKTPSLQTLELEAFCLQQTDSKAKAAHKYQQAANAANNSKQKAQLLTQSGKLYLALGYHELALSAFEQSLQHDESIANVQSRLNLCAVAAELKQPNTVLRYWEKLSGISEYAFRGSYLALWALLTLKEMDNARTLFQKLYGEAQHLTAAEASKLLDLCYSHGQVTWFEQLLNYTATKFSHEPWYQSRLELLQANSEQSAIKAPQERVQGNSPDLVELINKLIKHSLANGAKFSDSLRVFEDSGDLSIKVFEQPSGLAKQTNMYIPYSLMPLISDYNITVTGNKLAVQPVENMLNPSALETMKLMVDIYNAGDKLTEWAERFPYLALTEHPELLNVLHDAKPHADKLARFFKLAKENKIQELLIYSFLGSRTFNYKKDKLNKAGIPAVGELNLGLLSLIDFLNHRSSALGYESQSNGVSVKGELAEGNELFVRYNQFDPVMTYLIYGFVDKACPWLFSTPVELKTLSGKTLFLTGVNTQIDPSKTKDANLHLKQVSPNITYLNQEQYILDKLVFPLKEHAHLLRDVLTMVVKSVDLTTTPSENDISREVLHLERQLIETNLAYWHRLEQQLQQSIKQGLNKQSAVAQDISELATLARKRIQSYAFAHNITLF